MPVIHSPSHKYEIAICETCSQTIEEEKGQKCDDCTKSYHKSCQIKQIQMNKPNDTTNDIIWQCTKCVKRKNICSSKDEFEIKSTKKRTIYQETSPNRIIKQPKIMLNRINTYNADYERALEIISSLPNRIDKIEQNSNENSKQISFLTKRIQELNVKCDSYSFENRLSRIEKFFVDFEETNKPQKNSKLQQSVQHSALL